jgi:5-methylcytosine-specific restriction endonuclease McrA
MDRACAAEARIGLEQGVMMEVGDKKKCRACQQMKPCTEFGRNRAAPDGLDYLCRPCSRAAGLRSYYAHREKRQTSSRRWKKEHPETLARQQQQYRVVHADKRREYGMAWRARNRDHIAAYEHAWRERNVEHIVAYNKAYQPRSLVVRKRWVENNREKVRAKDRRRYLRGVQGGRWFSAEEWEALCEHSGNRCLCCGKTGEVIPDHVVPLAQGGKNSIDNIQPLCMECNRKKWTRSTDYRRPPTSPAQATPSAEPRELGQAADSAGERKPCPSE